MIKYCKIIDDEKGLVKLGAGCPDEYYQEIGMVERDVQQSDKDFQWYLKEKCPMKTDEEKAQEEYERKISNIKEQLSIVDSKSIRALRENEIEFIEKYKNEAIELRKELHNLGGE